jgi:hypothetical protein
MKVFDSIQKNHGGWEGQCTPWNGCICGEIHPPPIEVFWIQCDGPCQAWFNMSPECAGFDSSEAERLQTWFCRLCYHTQRNNPALYCFVNLPDHLLYNIFEFAASGTDKVHVMNKLSVTCKHMHHAVEHRPWDGLWDIIFRHDFAPNASRCRPSKRSRRDNVQPISTPKAHVEDLYITMCQKTEDAHMSLCTMLDSDQTPLSLARLRRILNVDGVLINRRSQAGRTFLQECCTADYVDARVVLGCIRELIGVHGANPNIFTTGERDGDRPALFFAISRLMPSVVEALLKAGASLTVKVVSRFCLVSDPSRTFSGSFTPLEFARQLQEEEEEGSVQSCKALSPYWTRMLHDCIQILSDS